MDRIKLAGDRDGLRMVGERDVFVAQLLGGAAHFLDGVFSVRRGGVHLQVAANVGELHEVAAACAARRLRFRRVISRSSGSM